MEHSGGAQSQLIDQVAIVTGGGSGIGRATCVALARAGACLSVVDLDAGRVQETVNETREASGGDPGTARVVGLVLDVRKERDMDVMARQTLDRFGRIDILVACAGILRPKDTRPQLVAEMPVTTWDEILETNLRGVFLSNRSVLPAMIHQRNGWIINISSVSGLKGRAYDSAYCASKFGIIGFSEALAEEVLGHNIRVQALLPDAVDTSLWMQNSPIPPAPHMLPPARVADLIVYMVSLPGDTLLVNPVIAPFPALSRRAKPSRKDQ